MATAYIPVPLVGTTKLATRAYEPDSFDAELTVERVSDRSTWGTSRATTTETEVASVVTIVQTVYSECAAANKAWAADLLAARDKVCELMAGGAAPEFNSAIAERERIASDGWMSRVAIPIRDALVRHEWQAKNKKHVSIAHLALGGDNGGLDIGTTAGGGILAADKRGNDVGYRGSLITVIWRMADGRM